LNLTGVSKRHSQRILPSEPKPSDVTKDDAFITSDENDLLVLIARSDSTEENGISPENNRIYQISIKKVEEWLKKKLLSETKKSSPVNKVLAKKSSTRRRSIIKKL
jgi:hypothetical protein